MMRRHLTGNDASQAVGMLQAGKVQRAVAGHFNVSQSVISMLWNRFQHTDNVAERSRAGRLRKTTVRQDRYFSNMAKRQRFQSDVRLKFEFRTATGVRVSSQTVRNRLHTANLRAYRPAVRPILTLRHRTARLQWARDHVNWQLRYWTLGLFRDESRFCVDFHDGRRRVWRMPGERYADCCVTEHDRFRGGSVMVWAGISIDGKTDLHMIAGNLSGVRYRD
jgi:transposase